MQQLLPVFINLRLTDDLNEIVFPVKHGYCLDSSMTRVSCSSLGGI